MTGTAESALREERRPALDGRFRWRGGGKFFRCDSGARNTSKVYRSIFALLLMGIDLRHFLFDMRIDQFAGLPRFDCSTQSASPVLVEWTTC